LKTSIVDAHNEKRKELAYRSRQPCSELRMLIWDEQIAAAAQDSANTCNSATLTHTSYGTNTGMSREANFCTNSCFQPVGHWWNEGNFYTYNTNQCEQNRNCDRYLQVVSEATTKMGCGVAPCTFASGPGTLVVCHYYPAAVLTKTGNTYQTLPYTASSTCLIIPPTRSPTYMAYNTTAPSSPKVNAAGLLSTDVLEINSVVLVGVIIGGAIILLLCCCFIFWFCKSKKKTKKGLARQDGLAHPQQYPVP